ncbi:MAG: hypothetical protein ACD_15C00022G0001 [uncultured bacterium]|nr:MAG: hypothetical protein ACD_15C00022G0001 [uncultured bacterium]
MEKITKKNGLVLLFVIAMMLAPVWFHEFVSNTAVVQAEDEDEEDEKDEEDEEDEDDEEDKSDQDEDSGGSAVEEDVEDVIVSPAKTVVEQQISVVMLADTDRDGIVDKDDPHPLIAEIYIVEDGNKNGITDYLEEIYKKSAINNEQ